MRNASGLAHVVAYGEGGTGHRCSCPACWMTTPLSQRRRARCVGRGRRDALLHRRAGEIADSDARALLRRRRRRHSSMPNAIENATRRAQRTRRKPLQDSPTPAGNATAATRAAASSFADRSTTPSIASAPGKPSRPSPASSSTSASTPPATASRFAASVEAPVQVCVVGRRMSQNSCSLHNVKYRSQTRASCALRLNDEQPPTGPGRNAAASASGRQRRSHRLPQQHLPAACDT